MNSRSLLALILIVSLVVVPGLQLAFAASSSSSTTTTTSTTATTPAGPKGPYFENLDIYTASSNAFWRITLSPVNATQNGIATVEAVSGVTAYELTAVKTTTATVGSQLFWGDGYKVLNLPFMPDAGAFLNVTATSKSAAQSAASGFDTMLNANFVQVGQSGDNYTFFSVAGFLPTGNAIFASMPKAEGGLANLTSMATLSGQPAPVAVLTGVKSGSSFTHAIGFGTTESAVVTNGTLSLASVFAKANVTVKASPYATSTKLVVHALDGLIASMDSATVSNNQAAFSGTYTLSVPAGATIKPNVTILSDPPVLSSVRSLSTGSSTNGGLVSVTLTFRNTALGGNIVNVSVNDSWWRAYSSVLSVSAGNTSFTYPTLAAGQNITRVYVLKVISSAANDIIIPAAKVSYSFGNGPTLINATTMTNQDELRINSPGPALMVQAQSDTRSGAALGTTGHYIVTVTNLGDGPAVNLQSGAASNPTLTQGAVWSFNTTFPFNSIVQRNLTQSFSLGYTAPDGTKQTLSSNPVNVILSHSGLLVPMMQFNLLGTFTPTVIKSGVANATYTLTNAGDHAASGVNVTETFANGMACKTVVNGTAKCTSTGMSISTGSLAQGADIRGVVTFTFSADSYLSLPALIVSLDSGLVLHNAGTSFVVPAGVSLTKVYAGNPVFQGQNDTVSVQVVNQGTVPVYNMSVSTTSDAFDTAFTGTLHQTYAVVSPNNPQSFSYTVRLTASGNHSASGTAVTYSVGGTSVSYSYPAGNVLVYKAITATTSTSPVSPTEGASFALAVRVQNPSTVGVTNVTLTIKLPQGVSVVGTPSGLQVSGSVLTMNLPSLSPGATVTQSANLKASSDQTIDLTGGTLKFQYLGQTIPGIVSTTPIGVGVDLSLRYELPIALAVILTLALAVYMHRRLPTQTK